MSGRWIVAKQLIKNDRLIGDHYLWMFEKTFNLEQLYIKCKGSKQNALSQRTPNSERYYIYLAVKLIIFDLYFNLIKFNFKINNVIHGEV